MLLVVLSSVELDYEHRGRFEDLYYTYKDMLFGLAFKLSSNKADAEDILQETFIKLAKNIKGVGMTNSRETAAFLAVILKNTAYDYLRKKSRQSEVSIEELPEIAQPDNILQSLVLKLQYSDTVKAIKSIPSPYCEVLYLHFVRDYSIKKTAHLLERKPETVKMQLVRGKKLLAERLQEVRYE